MLITKINQWVSSSVRIAMLTSGFAAAAALLTVTAAGQDSRGQSQSGAASGVARDGGQGVARAEQAPISASAGDYRIAPGDELDIRIEDAPELSRKCTVSSEGDITLNYLNRIGVDQKTPQELEKLIADSLRGRYLKDPSVAVTVTQYNSRSFFIQGAVRLPGPYIIRGQPSLLKLITIAGGLADNHGSTAFIIREIKRDKSPADGGTTNLNTGQKSPAEAGTTNLGAGTANAAESAKYDLVKVNINGLFKGEFEQNVEIEPGDIVNIPMSDVFFVAGEVRKPGSFPLKEGTTLRQAISMAEGSTFNASLGSGVIFRDDVATGKRHELKVDIGAVMRGKQDDVAIQANDIIIVPNSRSRSLFKYVLSGLGTSSLRVIP